MIDLSHLDTSVGALIRSGAALLAILLGSFCLTARPRTRVSTWLGVFLILDALGYGIYALGGGYAFFPHKDLVVPTLSATMVLSTAAGAALLASFWPELLALRHHGPELACGLVTAAAALLLAPFLWFVADTHPSAETYGSQANARLAELDNASFGVFIACTALVAAALLAHIRHRAADPAGRGRLLLATYLLVAASLNAAFLFVAAAVGEFSTLARAAIAVTGACYLVVAFCLLGLGSVGGWSRWWPVAILFTVLAATLVAMLLAMPDFDDGGFGAVANLLALAGVAYALFRLDLVGTPIPRPRAGVLASVALATLFITAEVVQNFTSDSFGLVTGGILAGAAVFVAYPLQRAAERAVDRGAGPAGSATDKYRRFVETAWRDGRLGANERLLLGEARRQLGLDAEAAAAIDEAVAHGHAKLQAEDGGDRPARRATGPNRRH